MSGSFSGSIWTPAFEGTATFFNINCTFRSILWDNLQTQNPNYPQADSNGEKLIDPKRWRFFT
jgi:hypothetical protein